MPGIVFIKGSSDHSSRGYFFPLKFQGAVTTIPVGQTSIFSSFSHNKTIILDNGQLLTVNQNGTFNEIVLINGKFELERMSLSFDPMKFEYLVFANDLRTCFGFNVNTENQTIMIKTFQSKESLLVSQVRHVSCCELMYHPKRVAEKLYAVNVSRNLSYIVLIYKNEDKILCDIVHIKNDKKGSVTLKYICQVRMREYSSSFETAITGFKDYVNWDIEFDESEMFCLFKFRVSYYPTRSSFLFSLKTHSMLKFSLPEYDDISDSLGEVKYFDYAMVKDSCGSLIVVRGMGYKDAIRYKEKDTYIEMLKPEALELKRWKLINLKNILIGAMSNFIVRKSCQDIEILVSTFNCVCVLDPFREVILKKFDFLPCDYITIMANSFSRELFVSRVNLYNDLLFVSMIDTDYEEVMSLKLFAKRSILKRFSKKEIAMVNLPKQLKCYLTL